MGNDEDRTEDITQVMKAQISLDVLDHDNWDKLGDSVDLEDPNQVEIDSCS